MRAWDEVVATTNETQNDVTARSMPNPSEAMGQGEFLVVGVGVGNRNRVGSWWQFVSIIAGLAAAEKLVVAVEDTAFDEQLHQTPALSTLPSSFRSIRSSFWKMACDMRSMSSRLT